MMQRCIAESKGPDAIVHMGDQTRAVIKKLMAREGFTGRKLAILAGIDQPSLSKYLSGKTSELSLATLLALAKALEVRVGQILGEEPLDVDEKTRKVVRAMEHMPESYKDAILRTTEALLETKPPRK